jgi:hypothetical protein
MSTALVKNDGNTAVEKFEQVVVMGDLSKLTAPQRLEYYSKVCESVGLNPYTRPFEYIVLNNKLTLYARKDATEQLRKLHGVNVVCIERETINDVFMVWVTLRNAAGREDVDMGAVNIAGLKGEALANAMMKAITKAKRRATLSISGLGWLDETEVETIPDARAVIVNDKGEILKGGDTHVNGKSNGGSAATTSKEDSTPLVWQTWKDGNDAYKWAIEKEYYEDVDSARASFKSMVQEMGLRYTLETREQVHKAWYESHLALADAEDVDFYTREQEPEGEPA